MNKTEMVRDIIWEVLDEYGSTIYSDLRDKVLKKMPNLGQKEFASIFQKVKKSGAIEQHPNTGRWSLNDEAVIGAARVLAAQNNAKPGSTPKAVVNNDTGEVLALEPPEEKVKTKNEEIHDSACIKIELLVTKVDCEVDCMSAMLQVWDYFVDEQGLTEGQQNRVKEWFRRRTEYDMLRREREANGNN